MAFFLIPVAATSAEKINPGSQCQVYKQKITYKKNTYTCLRSGKKLIWKVSKKLEKSNIFPNSSESPSFEKWSKRITRIQISELAQKNFEIWKKSQIPVEAKIRYFIDNNIDKSVYEPLIACEKDIYKYLGNYLEGNHFTFIGSSSDWIRNQIQNNSLIIPQSEALLSVPNQPGNKLQGFSNGENATFLIVNDENISKQNFNEVWKSVGAHEFFHSVQKNIIFQSKFDVSPLRVRSFPAWFEEGTAEFVGRIFCASYFKVPYTKLIYQNVDVIPAGYLLSDFKWNTPVNPDGLPYLSPYTIGTQATELIVANEGFQALLNIFIEQRKDQNFDAAFQRALGISVSDFYAYFESIRNRM